MDDVLVMCSAIGIDIGTTSVKICVINGKGKAVEERCFVHNAWIKSTSTDHREQNAKKILESVLGALRELRTPLVDITSICVTGQMHGIVLWNDDLLLKGEFCCSPLITWMDSRVPTEFISSLPKWECGELHAGYGMVTLAWLASRSEIDKRWNRCGTIMEMLNCYLTKQRVPMMGIQNAFSWGYCNRNGQWTVPENIVPTKLLPQVVSTGTQIGCFACSDFDIPTTAQVFSSLGDLQSTVYPLLHQDPEAAVLNLGTSAQLCFCRTDYVMPSPLLTHPFFDSVHLITAASLNGGNTLQLLADKIVEWASEIATGTNLKVDFKKLEAALSKPPRRSTVTVCSTFFGERVGGLPSAINSIRPDTSITEILHATASGVIENLLRLLPVDVLQQNGVKRVILAGNANKSYYLVYIQEFFKDFEVLPSSRCSESAAFGAALFALNTSSQSL